MRILGLMLLAAVVASAAVAATPRARVAVVASSPVAVQGTSFRSGERVTVTLFVTRSLRKTVTANAHGAFKAKFARAVLHRCEGYSIRAKGNRGSLAVVKVLPECPQATPADEPLFPIDPPPRKG